MFGLRLGIPSAIVIGATALSYLLPASGSAAAEQKRFELHPNPKVLNCLAADPGRPPTARVRVERGELNDTLHIELHGIKPNLAFDLFTIQRSNLKADGTVDPNFKNFGLAWYQSDLQVDHDGDGEATIRTILVNQIFGFDPDVGLDPLNTFHVGFWFNNPNDAAQCDPDPAHPIVTPFNGEHKAGPLAMISVPDAKTNLGPLCLDPKDDGTCNP
jgi:hypothetical protein